MGREDDQSFSEAYRPLWKMCVAKLEGAALGDLKTPVGVMRRDPSGENANRLFKGHAQRRGSRSELTGRSTSQQKNQRKDSRP
jgi:hypothetical protein